MTSKTVPFANTTLRLARRAFGLGYDTENKVFRATVLTLSSALLSIMSGFTTFLGLSAYLGDTPALLATVAIQSLLFAVSWMLGAELMRRNLKLTTLLTYLIPMCISSWFSYSALLEYLYDVDRRERDFQARLLDLANEQTQPLVAAVEAGHDAKLAELQLATSAWKSHVDTEATPGLDDARSMFEQATEELEALEAEHRTELQEGGPHTNKGNGPKAKQIKAEINRQRPRKARLEREFERLERTRETFEVAVAKLSSDDTSAMSAVDIQLAQSACKDLVAATTGFDQTQVLDLCGQADELHASLTEIKAANAFLTSKRELCAFDLSSTLDDVHACLAALPSSTSSKQAAIANIQAPLAHIGPKAHDFELSVALLLRQELLAELSFGLAIAFDLLILMCGLIGNRRFSYLDMNDAKDLPEFRGQAIDHLLAIDGDPLRKMRALLAAIEPLDVIGEDWGGFISHARMRVMSLGYAADPLIKMGLLENITLDDERGYAVHFSLSMHLCEKLLMGREYQLSEEDLLADIPAFISNHETTQPN